MMKPVQPETSPDDRRLGAAVHLIGIVGPLWLPLAAWLVFRERSAFVAAHAWQEFRDGIIWKGFLLLIGTASLAFSVTRLIYHYQTSWEEFRWQEIALRLAISLTVFGVLWVWNLLQALLQARAALNGIWPKRSLKALAAAGAPETGLHNGPMG